MEDRIKSLLNDVDKEFYKSQKIKLSKRTLWMPLVNAKESISPLKYFR